MLAATTHRATPKEVIAIARQAPIKLILYYPKTAEGQAELARRVADAHASAVTQQIKALNCPTSQKLQLLDAIIADAKARSREQHVVTQQNNIHLTRR